jgi:RHS repeat-associated protein
MNTGSQDYFDGILDDVRIYDKALSQAEVNDLYHLYDGVSYSHNRLNQYDSVGDTPYSYDDNGNLTDDGTHEYYYDCENRLTDVNQNDVRIASYKYDYSGRRVRKILYSGGSPSGTVKYCYDGAHVIAEYDGSDNLLQKFVYGPGIDEPICMVDCTGANEVIYYYHQDGLGSVVALSDSSANIVEQYSYDVFGEPNTVSSIGNPYLFTGRRYDSETSLYYYRARYYKPEIGRFLQSDPIHYAGGPNLYLYVKNNPVTSMDPFGLRGVGIGGSITGGSGVGGTTGAQFVIDTSGNVGIFVHAGGGAYYSGGTMGTADFTYFAGSALNLNGPFITTGGSGNALGGTIGGEYHYGGWDTDVGASVNIGLTGGLPAEVHHFIETGEFIPLSDIINLDTIRDYWTGVGGDIWDWLNGSKTSEPEPGEWGGYDKWIMPPLEYISF